MNNDIRFSLKQHVTFFFLALMVAGTCFLLDVNYDNLSTYAHKSDHSQLMARNNTADFHQQTLR